MPNKIKKINRKLKAAMKLFIDHEDTNALKSIAKLMKEREIVLSLKENTNE